MKRLLAAASALSLLLVAACGSGGAASGGGDASKKAIRIAYQAFPSGDLIVKNQGLLEKALPDYKITWTKFDSGASINTAFVAKSVDIAAIGSSPVARGLSAPLNIPYQVAFVLDVAGDNEALVARNGTGITDVAGLRGRKVATPFASTSHYSLLAALDQAGVKESEVTIVDLEPQDIQAAWTRGDLDAAYTWLPSLDEIKKTGKVLISSRQLATAGKPTLDLGVVSTPFAGAHPEAVDAWRKVEAQALNTIATDPAAAAKAVGAELNLSADDAAHQLQQGVFLKPADISSPDWLGTDGKVGKIADNLVSAAEFLKSQQKIDAVPSLDAAQKAIYVKGLPSALG
ncbi:glycine/betaine ABC transporter substrate-binding protein [Actinoplanes sp. SE50]|uniref:taurine ABC transporter substrate-binding protein n=1 Tax=unclassified Actinoplanes TaxID=2626549 RepID=UPI00023EBCFE|nr:MULTISPECIES: glycine betaine ABC transporter substrate-binding protein [unclassified Actinoplanes]AEV83439.1 Putative aliphatic sulfonates-binding protein [Actinoplanes sp. SE50/110]ATO81832.1 glycine/betaine ABC transporter substrate-binding protein [Actinoplanes sp. SE50]SLL99240.1 glycine/betaine ABC transporter substrate-binding protein [Actinoplanes sp. SE50/110]